MEYTSSTSLHFPAAYAPISEDEMIYIEGGADVISPQQFTYNLVTNLIRLLGRLPSAVPSPASSTCATTA